MRIDKKLYIIVLSFLIISCSKEEKCKGVDCLPQETQTGANKFACLVNGTPYIDESGSFNCYYQTVEGEKYFFIGGQDEVEDILEISLKSNGKELEIGKKYPLESDEKGKIFGTIFFNSSKYGDYTTTNNKNSGYIIFTKIDFNNRIISGRFDFKLSHPQNGSIINITSGRFDALFTI